MNFLSARLLRKERINMNIINQETGSPATGAPENQPQPAEAPQAPMSEPQTPAMPQEGQPTDGGDAPQGN
jgi:hypothetical protein